MVLVSVEKAIEATNEALEEANLDSILALVEAVDDFIDLALENSNFDYAPYEDVGMHFEETYIRVDVRIST